MTPRDPLRQGLIFYHLRDSVCGILCGLFLKWEYVRAVHKLGSVWPLARRLWPWGGVDNQHPLNRYMQDLFLCLVFWTRSQEQMVRHDVDHVWLKDRKSDYRKQNCGHPFPRGLSWLTPQAPLPKKKKGFEMMSTFMCAFVRTSARG